MRAVTLLGLGLLLALLCLQGLEAQVWDVDRLIRARNPGASFTTTERPNTTWGTLRSITYNPLFQAGEQVGAVSSVEEASLVRRVKPSRSSIPSSADSVSFAPLFVISLLVQPLLAALLPRQGDL